MLLFRNSFLTRIVLHIIVENNSRCKPSFLFRREAVKLNNMNILRYIIRIPDYFAVGLIRVYQFLFSTDHSFWAKPELFRICTYYPSCSEFTRLAILKHGLLPGSIMGLKRIIDCNPFSKGGHDPVPEHITLRRYKGKGAKPAR